MRQIKESDWKILRQLSAVALERFCEKVLSEVEAIRADNSKSIHQRYLDVFQLMRKRDKELAQAFDNLRRSTALEQLILMKAHGLITDEEFSRFSQETQDAVKLWLDG